MTKEAQDVEKVRRLFRLCPNFPLKGIPFQDVFPVFRDPVAVEIMITHFAQHVLSTHKEKIDVVVGLDARGFLLGPLIALRLGASFIPVRKAGKLPGPNIQVTYQKEYGPDTFEMNEDAIEPGQNVIIVDDVIATGGSAKAAGQLVEKLNGNILEYLCLLSAEEVDFSEMLGYPVYSMVKVPSTLQE
ncbi:adenine phosphoribosyltransferase [Basidiobolus ranarum]|uniref:adenine phosphoribosyltransferase n=1 Tax=Basidiobolus ranarum TaxID=34480 RepID=A0ABR2W488_9FUNG